MARQGPAFTEMPGLFAFRTGSEFLFPLHIASLILASHDTPGARAAEAVAFAMQPKFLHHLVVVPDFWKGMMGDDWLNNAITRERFASYVENQLQREIIEHRARLAEIAERVGISYECRVRLGKPAACLLDVAATTECDLVVIGAPRPRGMPGYRSRMALDQIARGLEQPLMIVPHPAAASRQ